MVSVPAPRWLAASGVEIAQIDAEKRPHNSTDGACSGRLADRGVSPEWFRSSGVAKLAVAAWRRRLNSRQLRTSLIRSALTDFKRRHRTRPSPGPRSCFPKPIRL